MNFGLTKDERLHSKKSIKELFDKGSSFFLYPFKVFFLLDPADADAGHQVLFSVSKRKIKRAVHRNWVKRRLKEAYRLNKHQLKGEGNTYRIALVYVSDKRLPFAELEKKVITVLSKTSKLANKPQKDEP